MITQIKFVGNRVVLFTPEGHESRIGTFFNGSGEFAAFKDPDGNRLIPPD